jgi:ribosomal subunit interface protein
MQVSITGKQLDVGDALRRHVEDRLADAVAKYFDHAIDSTVVLSRVGRGKQIRADISVHAGRGIMVQGHGETDDAYSAFDAATDRIAKRLRRYKRRLRDHRKKSGGGDGNGLQAQQYVLAEADDQESEEVAASAQPVVVAEMTTAIETMTVGEAVMRMDLADMPALVFQNSAHGGINVVFRRSDGNVGWIDPQGNPVQT